MAMRVRATWLLTAVTTAACAAALSGCGARATESVASRPAAAVPAGAAPVAAAAVAAKCDDGQVTNASLAPSSTDPASFASDSTMAKIKKRGFLRVATSGDVLLWGATNPASGNPEGYDVDLATEIAAAIHVPIVYTVIPYSKRLTVLGNDQVDLVAQQMTITCARWQGALATATTAAAPAINLSIPYYTAGAKFLIRSNSTADSLNSLKGEKVCGTKGSTSLLTAKSVGATTIEAASAGQCLVKFEEGDATVVVSDETTLAGFRKQDPASKILNIEPLGPGQYGLGTQRDEPDFTSFVNGVLVKLRGDGTLTALYDKWMKPNVVNGRAPTLEQPVYGRNLSSLTAK